MLYSCNPMAAVFVEVLSRLSVVYDNCAVEQQGSRAAGIDDPQHPTVAPRSVTVDAAAHRAGGHRGGAAVRGEPSGGRTMSFVC